MKTGCAYYRVSTQWQSRSGLGLQAQRDAVNEYAKTHGITIINEFIEIETGADNERPKLLKALRCCSMHKTILIIAKLDRLSRNVKFVSALMESAIKFIAVDFPDTSKLMLHIRAAFAEYERDIISIRIKESLRAARQRGVELGWHGKYVLSKRNKRQAEIFARRLRPLLLVLIIEGHTSTRTLAAEMNKRNIPTYRPGGRWHRTSVHNVLERLQIRPKGFKVIPEGAIPSLYYIRDNDNIAPV